MRIEYITSRQNPLLVHIKKILTSRSYRQKHRQFAADGVKLLREAVRWNAALEAVVMTEGAVDFELPEHVRAVCVPEDVMASVSLMEAPQGALFLCSMPEKKPLALAPGCLILDGLQDPGNVGTILRTADAFNVPVVLSSGCADLYNPKTVRATMGAAFRMDVQEANRESILRACEDAGVPIFSTALSDRAVDIREVPLNAAVVIGSEGKGVCREYLDASRREIIIPMDPRCESLNAAPAAAVVMWEMKFRK